MPDTRTTYWPSWIRIVAVAAISGLGLMLAGELVSSALITQEVFSTAFTFVAIAAGAAILLALLWFVPESVRPITVQQGRVRIPGYLWRTRSVTPQTAEAVWVKSPKLGSGDDFLPHIRTTDGTDLRLRQLAAAKEEDALKAAALAASALSVPRPARSRESAPAAG